MRNFGLKVIEKSPGKRNATTYGSKVKKEEQKKTSFVC